MKPPAVMDTECYRNYWLLRIRELGSRQTHTFELFNDEVRFAPQDLRRTLERFTIITFNGISYDMPMTAIALTGVGPGVLKRASDMIIVGRMRGWQVERHFNAPRTAFDHVDLIEVVPTMVSLKVYMGRLHCRRMQDLPIAPDATISEADRQRLIEYNDNDLDGTEALFRKFKEQLNLRIKMGRVYGMDLRSKSDAQIAEVILSSELRKVGVNVQKTVVEPHAFRYKPPAFLQRGGPILQEVLALVQDTDFYVQENGYVKMPKQLSDRTIAIGQGKYRMGLGGLHSSEQKQSVQAGDGSLLILDRDVASYYPAIIIETGLYPQHLGKRFIDVYRKIRDERIKAKNAGDKIKADSLKIALNGSFGKLGSPYSILYAPRLLIQTTVTGQLSLLMLIERIETQTMARVISANTDGIVILCPEGARTTLEAVIKSWEGDTGFATEETQYRAIYSRDVNSYIAIKLDGSVKLKGAYSEPEPVASSWPSPHNQICVTAACDQLVYGTPIEVTVGLCNDIRQFVEVRNVTGGATWRGQYLGKAVRWYKSIDGDPIYYAKANKTGNHNKVAGTDDCRPLMEMDGSIPSDLDRSAYVREAKQILVDVGASAE